MSIGIYYGQRLQLLQLSSTSEVAVTMPGIAFKKIHELALEQHGIFTAEQARELEIGTDTLTKMTRKGDLVRVARGLYRDPMAPETKLTPYMAAALWPTGVVGHLSHQTVLGLLDLSDVVPGQIDVTVPKRYRPRRREPLPGMKLHFAEVPNEQRTAIEGVPATTVARAIRDCATDNIGPALLRQAIHDARANGWLTEAEGARLTDELMAAEKL